MMTMMRTRMSCTYGANVHRVTANVIISWPFEQSCFIIIIL